MAVGHINVNNIFLNNKIDSKKGNLRLIFNEIYAYLILFCICSNKNNSFKIFFTIEAI